MPADRGRIGFFEIGPENGTQLVSRVDNPGYSGRVAPGITPWRSHRSGRAQFRHPARPVKGSPSALLSVNVSVTRHRGSVPPTGFPPTVP